MYSKGKRLEKEWEKRIQPMLGHEQLYSNNIFKKC